jgi:soluble lytic murein transglycosylase-like protein
MPLSPSKRNEENVAQRSRASTNAKRGSWAMDSEEVAAILPLVQKAAEQHGLPEDLMLGVIWVESRFNPNAVSKVGARGLMQLMPKTADYLAERMAWNRRVDAFDPEFNIAAGAYYIARLIDEFGGDLELALAAYNAGPAKVQRWLESGGLPEVSVEYAAMVQTARRFFGEHTSEQLKEPDIAEDTLDRLGLAILIAGLNSQAFGLEREDEAAPLD